MSRITVALEPEVVFGYDRPLDEYFILAYDSSNRVVGDYSFSCANPGALDAAVAEMKVLGVTDEIATKAGGLAYMQRDTFEGVNAVFNLVVDAWEGHPA